MNHLTTGLLYTLIDLANAHALTKIADSRESVSSRLFTSSRKEDRLEGATVSIAHLLNPFTIAACLGRSTNNFTNTAIIHAVSNALDGNAFRAMLALAMASYLSLYPILLLPPLVLLVWDRTMYKSDKSESIVAAAARLTSVLFVSLAGLLSLSFLVTWGSWDFLSATYGFHLTAPDLTPNVGLWWYFFIEIFDPFRDFFLGVFWLHLAGYTGGLTLRIRRQPLFVITTLLGIFTIFKPYPSISDVSLYLAFVPLYKHVFSGKFSVC
jgi:GPI-anchor transamidase subunit U